MHAAKRIDFYGVVGKHAFFAGTVDIALREEEFDAVFAVNGAFTFPGFAFDNVGIGGDEGKVEVFAVMDGAKLRGRGFAVFSGKMEGFDYGRDFLPDGVIGLAVDDGRLPAFDHIINGKIDGAIVRVTRCGEKKGCTKQFFHGVLRGLGKKKAALPGGTLRR